MSSGTATTPALVIRRAWAMPSPDTFSIPPIAELLDRWLIGRSPVADPFARNAKRATVTNDLNPDTTADYHMEARDFLRELRGGVPLDAFLLDPPYSPRQISECYQSVGRAVTGQDTQNARLYREVKDLAAPLIRPGGVAITCGWSGCGFGEKRGFRLREMLVVVHGGAHNATIVTAEEKVWGDPRLFDQEVA